MTAGEATGAGAVQTASRLLITMRSAGVLPRSMQATGVEAGRPPATSAAAIPGRCSTAISSTTVAVERASPGQPTVERGCPGGRCPDTTTNS